MWVNLDRHALLNLFARAGGKFVANTDDIRPQFQTDGITQLDQTALFTRSWCAPWARTWALRWPTDQVLRAPRRPASSRRADSKKLGAFEAGRSRSPPARQLGTASKAAEFLGQAGSAI